MVDKDSRALVDYYFPRITHNMTVDTFMEKWKFSNLTEVYGLVELCNLYGKKVEIISDGHTLIFSKPRKKVNSEGKYIDLEKYNHIQFLVVSDTHLGNKKQQLHLLNQVYQEAYDRGIHLVLHAGDLTDGYYSNRKDSVYGQFLHGFDEFADYTIDMYPKIEGIETKVIGGNHDYTFIREAGADVVKWICRMRDDMEYLGQDTAILEIDKVKIMLDHLDNGSSKGLSLRLQQRIENFESTHKPNMLIMGHYHKMYLTLYNNVYGILAPALCSITGFQNKMNLKNDMGAFFIDIYSDRFGHIIDMEANPIFFGMDDVWDEAGKDKNKVKKLEIKHGIY